MHASVAPEDCVGLRGGRVVLEVVCCTGQRVLAAPESALEGNIVGKREHDNKIDSAPRRPLLRLTLAVGIHHNDRLFLLVALLSLPARILCTRAPLLVAAVVCLWFVLLRTLISSQLLLQQLCLARRRGETVQNPAPRLLRVHINRPDSLRHQLHENDVVHIATLKKQLLRLPPKVSTHRHVHRRSIFLSSLPACLALRWFACFVRLYGLIDKAVDIQDGGTVLRRNRNSRQRLSGKAFPDKRGTERKCGKFRWWSRRLDRVRCGEQPVHHVAENDAGLGDDRRCVSVGCPVAARLEIVLKVSRVEQTLHFLVLFSRRGFLDAVSNGHKEAIDCGRLRWLPGNRKLHACRRRDDAALWT
eukprot:Opistho-2@64218